MPGKEAQRQCCAIAIAEVKIICHFFTNVVFATEGPDPRHVCVNS